MNSIWRRFNNARLRNRSLLAENQALREENEALKARAESKEDVEALKRSKERTQGLLKTAQKDLLDAVMTKKEVERRYDEVRGRLKWAEEAASELGNHARAQMKRLRASREEHGAKCARLAAERTRAKVAAKAQDYLSKAKQHAEEQKKFEELCSWASQVQTKIEACHRLKAAGGPVSSSELQALQSQLADYQKQAEAMELLDLTDEAFRFDPELVDLSGCCEHARPESPFGDEEFGIKSKWVLEPYQSVEIEQPEDDEDTAGNEEQVGQPGAEALLAAAASESPRSVQLVDRFVSNIISEVVEKLIDEIADRVVNEPSVPAKDPVTGEVLLPLSAPVPPIPMPSRKK